MLVIIYPTGTKRSIHLNHFVVEAEKADPDTQFVTTKEFLEKHLDEWPKDAIFVVRVGAYSVQEILPVLTKVWHEGKYSVFPNVPAIKNCLRKGQFYELCEEHGVNIPKFQIFADDGPDWHKIDFTEYGDCVIKPSIGTLGNGIYFVKPEDVANRIDKIFETKDEFYEDCEIIVQQRIQNKEKISQSIRVFCFLGEPTVSITITNGEELYNKAGKDLKINQEIIYGDNGEILDTLGYDLDFGSVSNVNKGGVAGPYFPNEELKEECRKICKATGNEFTCIDFLQDENGDFYCLESNVAPHLYRAFIIFGGKVNHPEMIFNYLLDNKTKGSIML